MIFHQEEQPSRIEDIPLIDGLIINKEDGVMRWLVEAYIDKQYKGIFEKGLQSQETLNLQCTISHESNDPASLLGIVKVIKEMEDRVSVLIEGNLVSSRINLAEIVLTDLVQQGLQGEGLLQEFKTRILDKKKKKPIES